MFGFLKKKVSYDVGSIENVLGVGLSNRSKFINYGDVAADNIYAGYAISRVFSDDQERLSLEFDAVYLHYLMAALRSIGISSEVSSNALERVFDNFEISAFERGQFHLRLQDYRDIDYEEVAMKFVENLGVEDFPENFLEPSRRMLGGQFHNLSGIIRKFVTSELKST